MSIGGDIIGKIKTILGMLGVENLPERTMSLGGDVLKLLDLAIDAVANNGGGNNGGNLPPINTFLLPEDNNPDIRIDINSENGNIYNLIVVDKNIPVKSLTLQVMSNAFERNREVKVILLNRSGSSINVYIRADNLNLLFFDNNFLISPDNGGIKISMMVLNNENFHPENVFINSIMQPNI